MNMRDILNGIYNFEKISVGGHHCLIHKDPDELITIKTESGIYQGIMMIVNLDRIKLVDYIFEKVYRFAYEEIIELK